MSDFFCSQLVALLLSDGCGCLYDPETDPHTIHFSDRPLAIHIDGDRATLWDPSGEASAPVVLTEVEAVRQYVREAAGSVPHSPREAA